MRVYVDIAPGSLDPALLPDLPECRANGAVFFHNDTYCDG